jgi:hypothetical protein
MGIGARLALVGDLVDGHSVLEQKPLRAAGRVFMPTATGNERWLPPAK